jgi:hypothetical protein
VIRVAPYREQSEAPPASGDSPPALRP